MILDGSTPRFRTVSISALDAQSKPVPSSARRRRTSGLGLHLMARHFQYDISEEEADNDPP